MHNHSFNSTKTPVPPVGNSAASQVLATAARIGQIHPRNAAARDRARRLVWADARAVLAWTDCDGTDGRLTSLELAALDDLRAVRHEVTSLDDEDLSLVLQGLLEIHLELAVRWIDDRLEPAALAMAAFPPPDIMHPADHLRPPSTVLAAELATTWHSVCFGQTNDGERQRADQSLRRIWQASARTFRAAVVFEVSEAAASVALAHLSRRPAGQFEHFEDLLP
ncbi:hypothetical protein GCM10009641_61900 [Mycobacterium cookii]|uniref:Uncharacterized protein n=1 Tax=Nocardioides furvisabuli TaxID=375542 RepID=A0ABN2XC37_9ACTN|nr:hypothetical protein [Nocardioides furvisabuli]